MRLIPGKTKVQIELVRGVTLWDILVGAIALLLIILVIISSLPHKIVFCIAIFFLTALLVIRMDEKPNYVMVLHMFRHFSSSRRYRRVYDDETLKKKGQNEIIDEYLEEYKEDIKRKEDEIKEDPDAEYYDGIEEEFDEESLSGISIEEEDDYDSDDSEYEEFEDYEDEESDEEFLSDDLLNNDLLNDDDLDEIKYIDDPDYTDDLEGSKKGNSKSKKKKGLYTISFGKKKENDGE